MKRQSWVTASEEVICSMEIANTVNWWTQTSLTFISEHMLHDYCLWRNKHAFRCGTEQTNIPQCNMYLNWQQSEDKMSCSVTNVKGPVSLLDTKDMILLQDGAIHL